MVRLEIENQATVTPCPPAAPMADHQHTIDRWDDATGEDLIEQIATSGGGEALAEGQDHAALSGESA
jgi:hypothetical protein